MSEENNILVITFPMGAKGHTAGRLFASCDNVSWYDNKVNGAYPWLPYNDVDENFTVFHFNRKFHGADTGNFCDKTVMGVLDTAKRNNSPYSIVEQKTNIESWKKKLFPNNLLYTNHSDLDQTVEFFSNAKHVLILPDQVENIVERFKNTTLKYYISRKDKNFTFLDHYQKLSQEQNISLEDCIQNDILHKIDNFTTHKHKADIVIDSTDSLLDKEYFSEICKKINLVFNEFNYNKVRQFVYDNEQKYS